MAVAFAQSMRTLAADRRRWSLPGLLIIGVVLGGWDAWFVSARVTVYASAQMARLEVDQSVHPIVAPVLREVGVHPGVPASNAAVARCQDGAS